MSETTSTATSPAGETTPRPIIQMLEQADAGGCCGGGSCGI